MKWIWFLPGTACALAAGWWLSTGMAPSAPPPVVSPSKAKVSDTVVLLDLSGSLKASDLAPVPRIVREYLERLEDNSLVLVTVLQHGFQVRPPLLNVKIPPSVTPRQKAERGAKLDDWERELSGKIGELMGQKIVFHSCYVQSLTEATQYFSRRDQARRRLIWVGDLLEDCDVPVYQPLRLSAATQVGPHVDKTLKSLPHSSLDFELHGVVLPIQYGRKRAVPFDSVIFPYWSSLADRLQTKAWIGPSTPSNLR